jgi:hypothetical protein
VDVDELRKDLLRRMNRLIGEQYRCWRDCPLRLCRRTRYCAAPDLACRNLPSFPPLTPEQDDAAKADLQRALRERARQDAGEGAKK